MDILHTILTSGIYQPNVYLNLKVKLPFNNTIFTINRVHLGAYNGGRLLGHQIEHNSHMVFQRCGETIIATVASSNFDDHIPFYVVEAVRIASENIPTIAYKPRV